MTWMSQRRRHLLQLLVAEILPRDKPAEHHPRVQWVRRDVTIFVDRVDWPPVVKIQRTVSAAAWRSHCIAVLLRAVNPVRKLVVRHHVIELPSRLIEPGAPRLAAVARNNRALIATKNHPPRLVGINPKFVVVVAPRRAFECGERLTSVMRLISCGVRDEHSIGVLRIHNDFPEVPTALPDAPVIRNTLPTLPAVVRTKQPALLGVHDQINPPRIARRKSNSD